MPTLKFGRTPSHPRRFRIASKTFALLALLLALTGLGIVDATEPGTPPGTPPGSQSEPGHESNPKSGPEIVADVAPSEERPWVHRTAASAVAWGFRALGLSEEVSATPDRGRRVYEQHCAGCHGVAGDGAGPAASMLYPPPRDFVSAEFKFSSRASPGLPTDADLRQIIRTGLRGTSMSGFPALNDGDLGAVIETIKSFSDRWEERQSPPLRIEADPWADDPEAGVRAGELVYHVEAVCYSCHPSYNGEERVGILSRDLGFEPVALRDDWPISVPRENNDGTLTVPPDFRRDPIKSGASVGNLYRVIQSGITTTAMPTWSGILTAEQLWGLSYYIRSLSRQRPYRVRPAAYEMRPRIDRRNPLSEESEPFEEPFEEPGEAVNGGMDGIFSDGINDGSDGVFEDATEEDVEEDSRADAEDGSEDSSGKNSEESDGG